VVAYSEDVDILINSIEENHKEIYHEKTLPRVNKNTNTLAAEDDKKQILKVILLLHIQRLRNILMI